MNEQNSYAITVRNQIIIRCGYNVRLKEIRYSSLYRISNFFGSAHVISTDHSIHNMLCMLCTDLFVRHINSMLSTSYHPCAETSYSSDIRANPQFVIVLSRCRCLTSFRFRRPGPVHGACAVTRRETGRRYDKSHAVIRGLSWPARRLTSSLIINRCSAGARYRRDGWNIFAT